MSCTRNTATSYELTSRLLNDRLTDYSYELFGRNSYERSVAIFIYFPHFSHNSYKFDKIVPQILNESILWVVHGKLLAFIHCFKKYPSQRVNQPYFLSTGTISARHPPTTEPRLLPRNVSFSRHKKIISHAFL